MSREVERRLTGGVQAPTDSSIFRQFFYLLRQELPRTMAPVVILMLLLMLGWFTPLGPVMTVAAPLAASIFLAWDNTDLVPARRQVAFKERFGLMRRHVGFHFGFGVLFLIPLFNIVLLSFAPVGGTLYFIERMNPTPAADPAGQRNL
jgi:CysZ protein